MKLRRLTLSGFKTFARHSEIEFDRGITAVVGPNGSGKSNIVDAIRWALGETNARELRGARMDEVIYSGGHKKGRMNLAEVELVLDNTEGRIPVEDIEVAVTRRVSRSGDSEYRLNGARVRLRDLERVLGATGLTQTGYSVVAQNDIDGIIQATPAQRRALIEQAAGVRALRAAAEDALDRVDRAELTLRRLDDLLEDAEPRLDELAEQAELALEQREFTGRLAELRGSLAREEWRAARGQLKQARRRLDAAVNRAAAAAEAEAGFTARFDSQRDLVALARDSQRNAAARLEAARLAAERAAGDARRWTDREGAAVVHRSAAGLELRAATAQLAEADQALQALAASGADVEASAGAAEQSLIEGRRRHAAALAAASEGEAAIAAADTALQACIRTAAELAGQHRELVARVQLLSEAVAIGQNDITTVRGRIDQADAEVAALDAVHRASAAELEVAERAAATSQAAVEQLRNLLGEAEQQLSQVREVAQVTVARAATLRGQVDGALGGNGAVAAAVSDGRVSANRLLDCFRVRNAEDAAAIEAALESHLGAWIAADFDACAALLSGDGGREEVLRTDLAVERPMPAPPGTRNALDAVDVFNGAALGAIAESLRSTWLATDLTTAREVTRQGGRAVLPDGRIISAIGVRGGGRPGQTLELAAEERAAADAAQAALAAERAALGRLRDLGAEVREAEAALVARTGTLQSVRVAIAETAALLTSARGLADAERRRFGSLQEAEQVRVAELGDLEQSVVLTATGAAAAESDREMALRDAESRRAEVTEARIAVEAAALALNQADTAASQARLMSDDLGRRVAATRQAAEAAGVRRDQAELRILAAETEAIIALVRVGRAESVTGSIADAVTAASAALESAAPALAESERLLAALDAERSEVAIAVARAADERHAADMELQSAEARVADLADVVRDDGEDEGPEPDAQAAEKAEREIVRLERRIAQMGPVNGLAPEQHEALAARVGVLRSGRDDVGGAAIDIRSMAAQLNQHIEARFDEVFGAVSEHFRDLYAELFPGGTATLRLEQPVVTPAVVELDAEEITTTAKAPSPKPAGVEILAQPAGKRLQPLSLLSGGERALTALAVILAMQQVNASPFYVFDEIDAPLDDSNVVRLTRLLKRLAIDQQFIVVTHNHITMAAADVLYGVTIDGDGVSSMLSVRLATAEDLAEREVVGHKQPTVTQPTTAGA